MSQGYPTLEHLERCYREEGSRLVQMVKDALLEAPPSSPCLSLPPPPPPRTLLLEGPSGIGKSYILNTLAHALTAQVRTWDAAFLGNDSEMSMRALLETSWKDALATSCPTRPVILIMDGLEDTYPRRGEERDPGIFTLLNLLGSLEYDEGCRQHALMVIGVVRSAESLDPLLMAAFTETITLSIPTPEERRWMLQGLVSPTSIPFLSTPYPSMEDIRAVAAECHGFLPSHLTRLVSLAVGKALEDPQCPGLMTLAHLTEARKELSLAPSVPPVRWKDIGGLEDVKRKLEETVIWFHKHANSLSRLGVQPSLGAILHGPPGTGKTMLAKAVATEAQLPFFPMSISDILDAQVGESEKALSRLFKDAKKRAPCILFMDECDALFGAREGHRGLGRKLVTQCLLELDGLIGHSPPVVVLGATNHIHLLDVALTRPGRLDTLIHVPLPDAKGREDILLGKVRGMRMEPEITLDTWSTLAKDQGPLEGWTGAELIGMLDWAGQKALTREGADIEVKGVGSIGRVRLADIMEAIERMNACKEEPESPM